MGLPVVLQYADEQQHVHSVSGSGGGDGGGHDGALAARLLWRRQGSQVYAAHGAFVVHGFCGLVEYMAHRSGCCYRIKEVSEWLYG